MFSEERLKPMNKEDTMIKGIHHVSMKCSSDEQYAKTKEFYLDVLSLPVKGEWEGGFLADTGAGCIEVFREGGTDAGKGVIVHFAFACANVDETAARIRDAGFTVFMDPNDICIPADPQIRARIAFCNGPLGEEIELFDEKVTE